MTEALTPSYTRVNNGRRLHDDIVRQIVRQIVHGVLKPGTALPAEPVLAQQFGVSRTVIREAMRILVPKGLLTVKHGSGMWVQPADKWDQLDPVLLFEQVRAGRDDGLLNEMIEVRRLLEPEAAALAAERRSAEDLASLRGALTAMAAVLSDPDSYTRHDIEFHERIFAAAHNRLLREALRPVAEALQVGRLLSIRQPGAPEKSLAGHEAIYAAIEQGDIDAARMATRRHILQFEADISAAFRQRREGGLQPMIESTATRL